MTLADRRRVELVEAIARATTHDLNNLLMAIAGNASLGLMDHPPASAGRDSVEQIDRAAASAAALARDLLRFLPRQAGGFEPRAIRVAHLSAERSWPLPPAR